MAEYTGTTGNDLITGGGDADTLKGLAGSDTLSGGSGNDELWGGSGNDTYLFGLGSGHDVIAYDSDTSTNKLNVLVFDSTVLPSQVRASRSGDHLELTIVGTADRLTISDFFDGNVATNSYNPIQEIRFSNGTTWNLETIKNKAFVGTTGSDTLLGTSAADVFNGGKGNDALSGKGGNDSYQFGRGDGHDAIAYDYDTSSSKLNVLRFKAGVLPTDIVVTRSGDEMILSIKGTTDQVTLQDFFYQDDPSNAYNPIQRVLFANGMVWNLLTLTNKAFVGQAVAETIRGTTADESISGAAGADTLYGVGGNDTLNGGAGNDELWGGAGNDTYVFGRGSGHDVIAYDYDTSANKLNVLGFGADVLPSQVTAVRSGDELTLSITGTNDKITLNEFFEGNLVSNVYNPVQEIHFTNGAVWNLNQIKSKAFVGTNAANVLVGTDDNDTFDGRGGSDDLYGAGGNDTYLFGRGDGRDLINYDYSNASNKLNVLKFKDGVLPADIVATRSGDEMVLSIKGTTDKVTLEEFFDQDNPSNAYNPIQRAQFADGTVWNLLTLTKQAFLGQAAAEYTRGTTAAELIKGAAGADTLYGVGGNDTLDGGTGNDELWGGTGNDVIRFGRGDGFDVIGYDYDTSINKLNVLEFKANVLLDQVMAVRLGEELTLSITGTSDKITVTDFFYGNNVGNVYNPVQEIRFSSGSVWTAADLAGVTSSVPLIGVPNLAPLVE
jgi:Ca2+-binding RTX toxin-like protein